VPFTRRKKYPKGPPDSTKFLQNFDLAILAGNSSAYLAPTPACPSKLLAGVVGVLYVKFWASALARVLLRINNRRSEDIKIIM
jgi:hypothetical protein